MDALKSVIGCFTSFLFLETFEMEECKGFCQRIRWNAHDHFDKLEFNFQGENYSIRIFLENDI